MNTISTGSWLVIEQRTGELKLATTKPREVAVFMLGRQFSRYIIVQALPVNTADLIQHTGGDVIKLEEYLEQVDLLQPHDE